MQFTLDCELLLPLDPLLILEPDTDDDDGLETEEPDDPELTDDSLLDDDDGLETLLPLLPLDPDELEADDTDDAELPLEVDDADDVELVLDRLLCEILDRDDGSRNSEKLTGPV